MCFVISYSFERVDVMAKTRTSAAVKNRYAEKNYDRIQLLAPKGKKAEIKSYAEKTGESVSAYILKAVSERMAKE